MITRSLGQLSTIGFAQCAEEPPSIWLRMVWGLRDWEPSRDLVRIRVALERVIGPRFPQGTVAFRWHAWAAVWTISVPIGTLEVVPIGTH